MREYPVARAYLDARVQTIYGGTTEIMKEIIGRSLGVEVRAYVVRRPRIGGIQGLGTSFSAIRAFCVPYLGYSRVS